MSDTQDKTDFGGIPRADTSSPIDNESHTDNKLQDTTEQDTTLYEKHFKNGVLKDQSEDANKNVSVEESEIFEQENDTNEDLNNEMEDFLKRDKMDENQKKIELVTPNEINSDVQSLELGNASEETGKSSEVNANLSKTSGPMTDSWRTDSAVSSSDHEIQVEEDINSSGSTTDDGEVQVVKDLPSSGSTTDDEILVLEDSPSAGSSTDEDVKVVEDYTEKQNLNPTSEVKSSAEAIESKDEPRPVSLEHSMVKGDANVSQGTQVTSEGILNSVSSSISEVTSSGTSTENFPENSAVLTCSQTLDGTVDQNSNSGNNSKVSEMVNAGTSTENYEEEFKVSQSTQVTEGTVDEGNSSTQDYPKRVQNSDGFKVFTTDTGDEEISNHRVSPPKAERRTSQQVAEIISQHLFSEEFTKKLDEINDMVKELTAVEFISPNLSLEDQETLNKHYGQKEPLEEDIDWETKSEVSESNTPKRKSKESPELEEDEQLQAIAKKCRLSRQALAGNMCLDCLEEQFRVASEQSNVGQSQREKVYEFPVTESGEYQEGRYKLCKHHIAKLDAMVVSAMSMENYLSQLNNEMSAEDFGSNEFSGKSTVLDSLSTIPKSGSSSARTRSFNKKNMTLQQSSVYNKEIVQPKEKLAGVEENPKGYGYLGIYKAFNCIKNLVLFVSFTGSLTIAITVAKIFGVTFPVPKSPRNLRNDSESSLQEFPDV